MKRKIFNIEFLRIVGCISIIFHHFFKYIYLDLSLYGSEYKMIRHGSLSVEMFFILSGFFFFLNFNEKLSIKDFIKKKLIRLYPVIVFAMILILLISLTNLITFKLYSNIITLSLLSGTPLVLHTGNLSNCWFVSAMFWTMIFYGLLIKSLNPKVAHLIIAIITFMSYSTILHFNNGRIWGVHSMVYEVLNLGILRALAGLGGGLFLALWYEGYQHNVCCSKKCKLTYTIFEAVCLWFIIDSLMIHSQNYDNQIVFVIAILFIVALFLMKKGYISQLLDNKICLFFSKYTYSLFITHMVIIEALRGGIWKNNLEFIMAYPVLNIVLTFLIILMLGVFTYHFVEKPSSHFFNNKFKIIN